MRIRDNGPARKTYRNFSTNSKKAAKTLERLSTGYKVNRSADDAAGLAVSEKMRAQITGLGRAESNAKEGVDLVRTAEGALQEMHDMAKRLMALAEQSSNGTYDDAVDRKQIQKEASAITSEIDRIAEATNFNGIYPLKFENSGLDEIFDPYAGGYVDPTVIRTEIVAGTEPIVDITDGALTSRSAQLEPSAPWPAPPVSTVEGTVHTSIVGGELTVDVDPANNGLGLAIDCTHGTNGLYIRDVDTDDAERYDEFLASLPDGVTAITITIDADNFHPGYGGNFFHPSGVTVECDPVVQNFFVESEASQYAGEPFAFASHMGSNGKFNFAVQSDITCDGGNPSRANNLITIEGDASAAPFTGVKSSTLIFTKSGGTSVNRCTPSDTTINFTGRSGAEMLGSRLLLGPDGAQGKYQFVADAADADTADGYTAVVIQESDGAEEIAAALKAAIEGAGGVTDFTVSSEGNKVNITETTPSGASAVSATFVEPPRYPELTSENGIAATPEQHVNATEGAPATTTVDFTGKTGTDLNGKQMMVGFNGSQGKYQFVTDASQAAAGFTPIVINDTDTAEQLAQETKDKLNSLEGFTAFSDAGKLLIKESENKGANALPVVIGNNLASDEISNRLNNKNASTGDITVSMMWDTDDDLDLEIRYVPCNSEEDFDKTARWANEYREDSNTLYYPRSARERAGGHLDIDANGVDGHVEHPVENVYYDHPAKGIYQIWIKDYSDQSGGTTTNATVRLKIGDKIQTLTHTTENVKWYSKDPVQLSFNQNIDGSEDIKPVTAFFYDPDDANNWSGPKISTINGSAKVDPAYTIPANEGRPARTRVDFSGTTAEDLLNGIMRVYDQSGTVHRYQFVEDESQAESGYTPIVISADASPSAIAKAVESTVVTPEDFTASVSGGVFKFTENNAGGRKAPNVNFTLRERRRIVTEDGTANADSAGGKWSKILTPDAIHLLVGETADSYNWVHVPIHDMHADSIGLKGLDLSTQEGAALSFSMIQKAVNHISDVRGEYGAIQNRLEHTIQNLSTTRANVQDAESLIRDTDIADEVMTQTKNNILMQTSEIMLSQASKLPEQVMSLLQ